jgi:hypothetical protein
MRLYNEDEMGLVHVKDGAATGAAESWQRCKPVS